MSGEPWRPVPRWGKREVAPGVVVNGCWKAVDLPHGVGHNAVCRCGCAWCVDERAALAGGQQTPTSAQGDLFAGAS